MSIPVTLRDMTTVDEYGVELLVPETKTVPESAPHSRAVNFVHAGIGAHFAERDDVVVTNRLAWFPDRSDTRIRMDPDVMVVVGRPRRARRPRTSYKAWAEEDVVPTIIIEVRSEEDTSGDYERRLGRAAKYGVPEVVMIDPFAPGGVIVSHLRAGDDRVFRTVAVSASAATPLTVASIGVTFAGGNELMVADEHGPWIDTVDQILATRTAVARVEQEAARAEQEAARADRLAAALRAAGVDPDAV